MSVADKIKNIGIDSKENWLTQPSSEIKIPIPIPIAGEVDYINYLESIRNGTFQMGKTTGFKDLDKYLLHKENTLNVCGGMDNVGKSTVLWYKAMLSAMYHGFKWVIYSSENTVGAIVRKLIEFYWNEPIKGMNDMKYKQALKFVLEHFRIIKNDDVFSYSELEKIAIELFNEWPFNRFLIDPFNSLKNRGGNKHEDDYEVLGEMLSFTKKYCSIWLNCHVYSTAARDVNAGFPVAPKKSQLEGGNKFANRCHDLIMVHRVPQHPTDWMWTEIHTQKIKEVETGGSYTPYGQPYKIKMCNYMTGFEDENGYNPVEQFHNKNNPKQSELSIPDITQEQYGKVMSRIEPNWDKTEDEPF